MQFYNKAQNDWKTICECGSKLMVFQSLLELNRKNAVQKYCESIINKSIDDANKKYEENREIILNKKFGKNITKEFEEEINQIYEHIIQKTKNEFLESCEKKEKEFWRIENWKDEFLKKIENDLKHSENYNKRNFFYIYNLKSLQQKELEFEQKLQSEINRVMDLKLGRKRIKSKTNLPFITKNAKKNMKNWSIKQ